MKRFAISSRDRRTLVLGALAIGTIVLLGPGRRAEQEWDLRSRMTSERAQARLRHSSELLISAIMVRDSLRVRRLRLQRLAPSLLTADTRAAAGPALAGLVSRLSAAASLTVNGIDVTVDSGPGHPLPVATVHMSAVGDVNGLASFISHCEASPTRVAVRALSITQPEPTAPQSRMEGLRIDVTVSAVVMTWHSEIGK